MAKKGSDFKYQEIEIVCVREQLFPYAGKLKTASKVAMIFKRFIGRRVMYPSLCKFIEA